MRRTRDDQLPVTTHEPEQSAGSDVLQFPASPLPIRAREEDVLSALYARRFQPLCDYAAHYAGEDEAEDIVQCAFVSIWQRYISDPKRHRSASFDAMLFREVRFRVMDYRRNIKVERSNFVVYMRSLVLLARSWMQADARVEYDGLTRAISAAIADMSPRARELHIMHQEAGLSVDEIVGMTGVGRETVRSLLNRGNRILRQHLERAGYSAGMRRSGRKSREIQS
jgi:RNA polymerase sigma factor (sigma-70 family)